jgi:hypothetical protein
VFVRHRRKRRRAEFGIVVAIVLRSIKQWLNRPIVWFEIGAL